jgi:hypothetical protein
MAPVMAYRIARLGVFGGADKKKLRSQGGVTGASPNTNGLGWLNGGSPGTNAQSPY